MTIDPRHGPFTEVVQQLAERLFREMRPNPEPSTTALPSVIYGLKIGRDELIFHANRIRNQTNPLTPAEGDHFGDLASGYIIAAHYVGILLRYQEGRLGRRNEKPEIIEEHDPFAPVTEE
jgi:hypothetical protein